MNWTADERIMNWPIGIDTDGGIQCMHARLVPDRRFRGGSRREYCWDCLAIPDSPGDLCGIIREHAASAHGFIPDPEEQPGLRERTAMSHDEPVSATLEIEGPLATCGHCRFTTALTGTFAVENGLLVWRGAAQVQPRRGPGLESCCESYDIARFTRIDADGTDLSQDDIAALRASDRQAVQAEMAQWARERRA